MKEYVECKVQLEKELFERYIQNNFYNSEELIKDIDSNFREFVGSLLREHFDDFMVTNESGASWYTNW